MTLGIGFGAGLLNAMIGVGGGILIVPGLVLARRVDPKGAVPTSLGTVLVLSTVALAAHLAVASFHLHAGGAILLLVAGIVGSRLGTFVLHRTSIRWILFSFAGVALVSATHMMATGLKLVPSLTTATGEPPFWAYGILGVIGGFFSGLVGIGGGSIVVLGLSMFFQVSVLAGLPIAQAVNVLNSLTGVLTRKNRSLVRWRDVGKLVPSGLLGVAAGQSLAMYLPADALRVLFGLFFVYMSTSLIRRAR